MKPDPEQKKSIRKPQLRKPELIPAAEEKLQPVADVETRASAKVEKERLLLHPSRIAAPVDETEETPAYENEAISEVELPVLPEDKNEVEESEEPLPEDIEPEEADDVAEGSAQTEIEAEEQNETAHIVVSRPRPQLRRIIDLTQAKTEIESEPPGEKAAEKTYFVPDIPLRFSTFDEALNSCRELHPSPEELLMDQTAVQRTWLMSQLKKAITESEIEALAYSLNYKDLSVLFPVLSTLKKKEEVNQIQNLIRLRASHFLYVCGWLTFQFSYPRSTVARVLADLCMILDDISFLREELSQREPEQSREYKVPDLGPDRILWNEIEMISEISLPNSRRFVSDIANELYKSNIDEDVFLKRYAIYPNLALGKAILKKYEEIASGMEANPMLSNAFLDRFRRDN
ncbi:MAG: hypothetical protein PHR37_06100 [Eubacteriales bacterium]|nr:hypothetical protein [Eubacteriales bacterium]